MIGMKSRKVLFVGDGGHDKRFQDMANRKGIHIDFLVKPLPIRVNVVTRHMWYFILAVKAAFKRKNYGCVFIWQQYIGIYYSFVSLLYPFNRKPATLFYVLYKPHQHAAINRIKFFVFTRLVNSPYLDCVLFLDKESLLYRVSSESRRLTISLKSSRSPYIDANYPGSYGNFVFSGGASNRDYGQIKELALRCPGIRFVVACLPKQKAEMEPLPENLTCLNNAYGEAFDNLILNCRVVILPIADGSVVSGQLVLVTALQAGKVVFVSTNSFIDAWLGGTDKFVVTYKDVKDLHGKLRALPPDEVVDRGRAAREYYEKKMSPESMYMTFLSIILRQMMSDNQLDDSHVGIRKETAQ